MGLLVGIFSRLAYGNLNLIDCGPFVAGRRDSDRHFLETLFEVWVRACLIPETRRPRQQGGQSTNYYAYIHPHMAWDKLTNLRFNSWVGRWYSIGLPAGGTAVLVSHPWLARMTPAGFLLFFLLNRTASRSLPSDHSPSLGKSC